MKNRLMDLLLVTLGSLIAAFGFNTMFLDNQIASGGMVGLAVVFNKLLGWSPSVILMLSNIPLLILCYFLLGPKVFLKTVYGAMIYPLAINLTSSFPTITKNPLLAVIFGGIIVGLGLGLVFRGNSSTGGTGIITQIIHKYTPLSLGASVILIDGISVLMGLIAFSPDRVMYSTLALMVISYVINRLETGFNASKMVMIISKETEQIKEHITKVADRGVTQIPIQGGYSTTDKTMLMTTISSYEFPALHQHILSLDEAAFIVVLPASQVFGRGFSMTKHHLQKDDIILPM
ncbi:YitT family protein [Streptococcus cuniculipharyngis]|uniref:YitT family protein n=1 Tax=Streptococcus cuniculipharyngis TaxID=1562651 RepID=A0A5C5SDQ3_9STRE|nr:YitT family protein [Streptococcus cuniculipharyngis]TWS97692.1 YitT family protein [Streptococcus cuniculipharyngis]